MSQYFREGVPHDNKVSQMIAHAYAFDVIVCQSEFEALVLEASQIKAHTPKYNILLKDDKGYSYIKVTKDEWPRLSFTLQKEDDARSISALYLELCGPSDGRDGDGCFSAAPVQPAVPAGNWPGPSLPERPHRQMHGGVQRQDKP